MTGLAVRSIVLRLSELIIGIEMCKFISLRRDMSQLILVQVEAMLLYSASVELCDTTTCFFEDHDIRFVPMKMQ